MLIPPAARPVRFVASGLTAASLQLAVFDLLLHAGWHDIPANIIAIILSSQINFILSLKVTWYDRGASNSWLRSWALYQVSCGTMALLNFSVFLVARLIAPALLASALGTAAGAAGNYVLGDRLVFRPHRRVSGPQPGSLAAGTDAADAGAAYLR